MNILIITPYLPWPDVPHGGGQDLFALIRFLGERHCVSVASFADSAQADHADELRPYVHALTVIRPAFTLGEKISRLASGTLRSADAEMRAAIRNASPDVLYAAWTEMGRYLLDAPPGPIRVLDEVDVRFLVHPDLDRKAAELAYCRAADLVVTRSARDLAALRAEIPALRGSVLPPIAHASDFLTIPPQDRQPGRVLFMGAMNRRRNQIAARWFLDSIWPKIIAALPTASLRIVGIDPPSDLVARSGQDHIEVTGWAPDLGAEYARAAVVVAPMQSEAGALNKVIDALAAGRPVVATRAANAGIDAPPDAVALADDPAEFAQAVIHLLTDDSAWVSASRAARKIVENIFDWRAAAETLEANLLELRA